MNPLFVRRTVCASALVLGLASCSDSPTEQVFLASVLAATALDAPNKIAQPLRVELDVASEIQVDYWAEGTPRLRVSSSDETAEHDVVLYRLRAATSYQFEVTPVAVDGTAGDPFTGVFETDTLPTLLQGVELHSVGRRSFPLLMIEEALPFPGMPIIVDRDGEIVWYRADSDARTHGFTIMPDGKFVINTREGVDVLTPDAEVVASLSEADAATRTGLGTFEIHHDVINGPGGALLLLVQDTGTVNDTVWTGEAIWEWDYVSDELEKKWSSFDFMSPVTDRTDLTTPDDWLHANALSVGPRGNILVSFFWTHEVVSIAADYQSLEWRLGGQASTFTVLDGAMDAGQHTAAEIEENRVLLFDNGRGRPGGELFSRASELLLDPVSGEARIVWEFRPFPDNYAPIVGSARRLPNDNTVINFGLLEGRFDPPSTGPIAVYEVSQDGVEWATFVEGLTIVYRSTPMFTIGGEFEVENE